MTDFEENIDKVLVAFIRNRGGATHREIIDVLDLAPLSVGPRVSRLERAGKIVDSGERREMQTVWKIKEA